MANANDVAALIACWANGDDDRFRAQCAAIAANERAKGHPVVAERIEQQVSRVLRSPRTLQPLPAARGKGTELLLVREPARTLRDVCLPADARNALEMVATCWRQRSDLRAAATDYRGTLLLIGPSGCGKSVTAEALAGELGVPFVRVNLLSIVSSYLGETAAQLGEVFEYIGQQPCVATIDEFEALGGSRDNDRQAGEMRRVTAGLLQILDEPRRDSILVATCNHPALVDFAFWRRFDEVIHLPLPDAVAREQILTRNLNGTQPVDLDPLVAATDGFSGASVESIALDAVRLRVLCRAETVTDTHLHEALAHERRRRDLRPRSLAEEATAGS